MLQNEVCFALSIVHVSSATKKHPDFRGENDCNCEECKLYNVDHNNYRGSLHEGCKSCDRLVDAVGAYKFSSIDKNIKPVNNRIFSFEIIEPSFELPPASDPSRPSSKEFVKSFLVREKWCEKLQNYIDGVKDEGMWCYVCSTLFIYEYMLKKHLSIHDVGRIFNHKFGNEEEAGLKPNLKCYQCSTVFNTKPGLIRHIESVHYKEYVD